MCFNYSRIEYSLGDAHPFGLALFEDWLYWTDWNGEVAQLNRFIDEKPVILHARLEPPRGMAVAHINKQRPSKKHATIKQVSHFYK